MTTIQQRDWRGHVRNHALNQRLAAAGCPLTTAQILAQAHLSDAGLVGWVRISLGSGVMLRTSQAEHIARGKSLVDTARITGIAPEAVLYYLTEFEEDDPEQKAFYVE